MPIYRGRVVSFDSGTYRATVRLDGSPSGTLSGVAVSRGIPSAQMVVGRRVLVDTGDHGDVGDAVVYAVTT